MNGGKQLPGELPLAKPKSESVISYTLIIKKPLISVMLAQILFIAFMTQCFSNFLRYKVSQSLFVFVFTHTKLGSPPGVILAT